VSDAEEIETLNLQIDWLTERIKVLEAVRDAAEKCRKEYWENNYTVTIGNLQVVFDALDEARSGE
jgi:hypothetical protein